eukprot:8826356-Lingulodinium_polyedra.AAC.1
MPLMPTQQIIKVMEESEWKLTQKAMDFMTMRNMKMISTQLLEDGFQRQRTAEKLSQHNQAAPKTFFKSLLKSDIIGTVHDYKAIMPDARLTC